MSDEGSSIDWRAILEAGRQDRLLEVLRMLPRTRWAERDWHGDTFLHFAVRGANVAALVALLQSGLDVNAHSSSGRTPAHYAVSWNQPRSLEVLCAAGVDLTVREGYGFAPLDYAMTPGSGILCARVLVANGVRLSTVREDYRHRLTPELVAFEHGVLRCRVAVVAVLHVKRASGQLLVRWDRYLLKQLALELWATRYDKQWQLN